MASTKLELKNLDKETANQFFVALSRYWKKDKLTKDNIISIYNSGVELNFVGGAPGNMKEQVYVLYYRKFSDSIPLKLIINVVVASGSSRHDDLLSKGDVIVAGTILNGKFESFSSSWLSKVQSGTPAYHFGAAINKIFTKAFGI